MQAFPGFTSWESLHDSFIQKLMNIFLILLSHPEGKLAEVCPAFCLNLPYVIFGSDHFSKRRLIVQFPENTSTLYTIMGN
jgi:hypothetical protein